MSVLDYVGLVFFGFLAIVWTIITAGLALYYHESWKRFWR